MKKRKSKFIKLGILLFGVTIFLQNCEKEVEIHNHEEVLLDDEFGFKIETLTFEQALIDKKFSTLKGKFKIEEPFFNRKKKILFKSKNSYYC